MKKLALFLFIAVSYTINAQKIDLKNNNIIIPKVGLKNYPIDKTTLPEIIKAFGNDYEKPEDFVINENEQLPKLYELNYKKFGISFYILSNDNNQTIRAIKFTQPFSSLTENNIKLGTSTLGDVLTHTPNSSKISVSVKNEKEASAHINEFKLVETGISFSAKIANYNAKKHPSKKQLEALVIDEIYISNYQHIHLIN
ncbi:hypothetical protein [Wenyingzhuangia sp. IMCC45467]